VGTMVPVGVGVGGGGGGGANGEVLVGLVGEVRAIHRSDIGAEVGVGAGLPVGIGV